MALIFNNNLLNRIFGREFNKISTLPITVTVRETHQLNQRVTRRAVQGGEGFVDNVIIDPDEVIMECICTNDFLGDSWQDKYAKLDEIRKAKAPFDVVTSIRTYSNMFFSGAIVINRDKTNSQALVFTAPISQINILSAVTESVPFEESGGPEADKREFGPAQDVGKVQGQTPSDTQNSKVSSILFDAVGG